MHRGIVRILYHGQVLWPGGGVPSNGSIQVLLYGSYDPLSRTVRLGIVWQHLTVVYANGSHELFEI